MNKDNKSLRSNMASIIAKTIAENDRNNVPEIRRALRDAYPLESTRHYAYKVWLKEVHCQLGYKLKRSRTHKDQLELF